MEVDQFLLCQDVLGLVQPGYPVKLFPAGRVPHGRFLSMEVIIDFERAWFLLLSYHRKSPASKSRPKREQKTPKKMRFQGAECGASKTVVFGCGRGILIYVVCKM